MIEDFHEEQRKKTARVRSFMDYAMGILLTVAGVFFLVYGQFGIKIQQREHNGLDYLIGILFIAYGSWRIYRGYKKDYFR